MSHLWYEGELCEKLCEWDVIDSSVWLQTKNTKVKKKERKKKESHNDK